MAVLKIENRFVYQVVCILLGILFCTYLRVSLLLIYPFVVLFVFYIFNWKLHRNAFYVFAWIIFCWVLSFRSGFYLRYNFVSFYYFIPFLLLLFASPKTSAPATDQPNYLKIMMNALTVIAIVNDIPGLIQYFVHQYDDSFVGIYGSFTVSQNGLSILNAILFFYHLTLYVATRKKRHLILFPFFIFCCLLGFYGAGQVALIATIILTFLKVRRKNMVEVILFTCLILVILVIAMKIISPLTLDYNLNIVKFFLKPVGEGAPRKLIIFYNYLKAYPRHLIDFFFGSGPGTFNSRTAFMVGSPTYFNVEFIKSANQPYYFREYAYTLWNPSNTGPYDGFMNQPFTSLLSVLGEYGLILAISLLVLAGRRYYYFNRLASRSAKQKGAFAAIYMYRFCTIYCALLIVIDNYIEYPEIIALLLIILKLSEQELKKAYQD